MGCKREETSHIPFHNDKEGTRAKKSFTYPSAQSMKGTEMEMPFPYPFLICELRIGAKTQYIHDIGNIIPNLFHISTLTR